MKIKVVAGGLGFTSRSAVIDPKEVSNPQLNAVVRALSIRKFQVVVNSDDADASTFNVSATSDGLSIYATVMLADNKGRAKTSVELRVGNIAQTKVNVSILKERRATQGFDPKDDTKVTKFVETYLQTVRDVLDSIFEAKKKEAARALDVLRDQYL